MREKCLNTELFLVRIKSEYRKIQTRKNSVFGHFSRSVLAITEKTESGLVFTFNHVTKDNVMKELKDLDVSKALQENDIPTKIIKEIADIFFNFIYQSFNHMIYVCIFPKSLK